MDKKEVNKRTTNLKKLVYALSDNINKLEVTAEKVKSSKNLADFYNSVLREVLFKFNYKDYITRDEFLQIFQENFKEHDVENSLKEIMRHE